MNLVDTHTHLYSEEFDADRSEVVKRAVEAGVETMFLPAIDPLSYSRQEDLVEAYPLLFRQMMGLHPTSVTENYDDYLTETYNLLFSHPEKYVAVGEIGLDFYWDCTYRLQQEKVLRTQLQWARKLNKPVSLHLRSAKDGSADAYESFFSLLCEREEEQAVPLRGVLHCFCGTIEQARRGVELGLCLGIGGVVTYKHSIMAEVVSAMPLECMVLETDAPYLAPVPHRGKRNESAYLVEVAQYVAALKGTSAEDVATKTSATASRLFLTKEG